MCPNMSSYCVVCIFLYLPPDSVKMRSVVVQRPFPSQSSIAIA